MGENNTKKYTYSLIYREVSGYPGDNPTEWEVRKYTYKLFLAGDVSMGAAISLAENRLNSQADRINRIKKTADTAKNLGIAGTVLGSVGTVLGIGNTIYNAWSFKKLKDC